MVDVSELVRFTPGEKTLRMAMDIAAAIGGCKGQLIDTVRFQY
jgi:hypothetical protein